jgi:stage V sporulation protein D (sporulation-specific penicillin-binding protein)
MYISGGVMAAPTVGAVMADILPYLEVSHNYKPEDAAGRQILVEDYTGLTLQETQKQLKSLGLTAKIVGTGTTIVGQIPAPGNIVPGNSQILLYTNEIPLVEMVKVPDFTGMTRQQASDAAGKLGLYILVKGNSALDVNVRATSQSIGKDTVVPVGTTIEIEFTDTGARD